MPQALLAYALYTVGNHHQNVLNMQLIIPIRAEGVVDTLSDNAPIQNGATSSPLGERALRVAKWPLESFPSSFYV